MEAVGYAQRSSGECNRSATQGFNGHAVRGRLSELNRILAGIACSSEYDLQVVVADHCFRLGTEAGHLQVALISRPAASRTTVTVDSQDVLKSAVSGGRVYFLFVN